MSCRRVSRHGEDVLTQRRVAHAGVAVGERGFTLIELLIVISLISILAAMGMVQYRNSVQRTTESDAADTISSACATRSISTTPTRASTRRRSTRWSATATCARFPMIRSPTPPTPGRPCRPKPIRAIRRRAGHLRRQERRPGHRARRHRVLRVLDLLLRCPQSVRQGLKTLALQRGLKAPLYKGRTARL